MRNSSVSKSSVFNPGQVFFNLCPAKYDDLTSLMIHLGRRNTTRGPLPYARESVLPASVRHGTRQSGFETNF